MEVQGIGSGEERPKFDFDRMWFGIIAGIIGPFIGFVVYYMINYFENEFWSFVDMLLRTGIYVPVLKLSLVANLLVFFIFIWLNKNRSAKGVIAATLCYAFFIVYLSFTGA